MKVLLASLFVIGPLTSFLIFNKEEKTVDGPAPRQHWFAKQRLSGERSGLAYKQRDEALVWARNNKSRSMKAWQARGPINTGGRVTDLVANPNNDLQLYVASASGGLYKSEDGGKSFHPVFDNVGSPAIGAVGVDPKDFNTVYVGTGEANPGGGSSSTPGNGVWKSIDGGQTWTFLGLKETRYIGKVAVDPVNSQRVFVAAMGQLYSQNEERGLFLSEDGGKTWKKSLFLSGRSGVIDFSFNPKNSKHIIAATWERWRRLERRGYGGPESDLWQTLDGGKSWTKLTKGLPQGDMGRIGVSFAPSNSSKVYAIYADPTGYFAGLFTSENAGQSWQEQSASFFSGTYSSYGWWFGRIFVHPTDEDKVWGAGVRLMKSSNGGRSFSNTAGSVHADQHAMWFNPVNPDRHYLGNDGGVYFSDNGGKSYQHRKLDNMQFYAVEVDPKGRIAGGLQDNGTYLSASGGLNYQSIGGGDGFTATFVPGKDKHVFTSSQYGVLWGSTNLGSGKYYASSGLSGRKNWHTPYTVEESDDDYIMYYGSNFLYQSKDLGRNWQKISGDLTDGDGGGNLTFGTITTIASSPVNRNLLYVGTDDGNIWHSPDRGISYIKITDGLPKRWVSKLVADPKIERRVYLCLSGFRENEFKPQLYRSDDAGKTWQYIGASLPSANVNDIEVLPDGRLSVASDIGVFLGDDQGLSFSYLAEGFVLGVPVLDIDYHAPSNSLFAATYGRGIFSLEL